MSITFFIKIKKIIFLLFYILYRYQIYYVMREVNQNKTGAKVMKLIDSCDYAANYAKVNEDGTVTVETLYRYGKAVVKIYTKDEFIASRNDIAGTKELTLNDVKKWGI